MKKIKLGTDKAHHDFNPGTLVRVLQIMDVIESLEQDEGLPLIEINSGHAFFHTEILKDQVRCVSKCREELNEVLSGKKAKK